MTAVTQGLPPILLGVDGAHGSPFITFGSKLNRSFFAGGRCAQGARVRRWPGERGKARPIAAVLDRSGYKKRTPGAGVESDMLYIGGEGYSDVIWRLVELEAMGG